MSNVPQALSATAGAVIGFVVGGPAGAFYGFQVGLLAGSVLFPTQLDGVHGPRLEDVERAAADPGDPIPIVYGTACVSGFRLYLCDQVTEVATTEEVGGKGPPSQEVTTYSYFQTLALGLCEGPIQGIGRIWENGELVYDPRDQLDGETEEEYQERIAMSGEYADTFTLYLGTEDQEPDPTLEAELGSGNVPAFRGLAYIVFPDRALKQEQGNRHPLFKVEVAGYGIVSSPSDTTRVIFNNPGANILDRTWTVPENVTLIRRLLLVGGGGGGATGPGGGGGGGGGVRVVENIPVTPGQSLVAVVGEGGGVSTNGTGSSFAGYSVDGGGSGSTGAASAGASGGGGGAGQPGGAATGNGLGNPGGDGGGAAPLTAGGGGGGGAGEPGESAIDLGGGRWDGGKGGDGVDLSAIFGTGVGESGWFGGGGGGAPSVLPQGFVHGAGGKGGGRPAGGGSDIPPHGTGGGGGGPFRAGSSTQRQVGANGLVLIEYSTGGEGDTPPGLVSIASILSDVCARAGLAEDQIDVSDMEEHYVRGYPVARMSTARAIIDPLRVVGLFDYVESSRQIIFRRRGGATVAYLQDSDLAVVEEGAESPPAIIVTKAQDVELPRQIRLRYSSYARDYERGEQLSPARIGTVGVNDIAVDIPVVIDDDEAAQIAEIMFREAWASRWSYEFALGPEYHALEPGDVVTLPVDGRRYRVRITGIDDAGLMIRRVRALRDDDGSYVSSAIATAPVRPSPRVVLVGETELELLDIPALRDEDDDPGLYAAMWRSGVGQTWHGARLHRSVDSGATWQEIATVANQAVVGELVSAPSSGDGYTWDDEQEIVVDIVTDDAALSSRTDEAVVAGANLLAIGEHGRWHLVQFANAELVSPGRYRLTRLLLGRRGTEHLIGSEQAGDRVVLLSGPGIIRVPMQTAQIGASLQYRAVSSGSSFASVDPVTFIGAGQALKPFSPVSGLITRDESGNITLTAIRRDRLSATLRDGVPVPMSETEEAYEVDVLDGPNGSVVRTIDSLSTPEAEYSAVDQASDFGGLANPVTMRIYQLSASVGRGQYLEVTG